MKHRGSVLWLCVVLLVACGGSPVPAGSSAAPSGPFPGISQNGGPPSLKLLPVRIDSRPDGAGWKVYTVQVALENPGPAMMKLLLVFDSGTVETQEGTTYQIDVTDFSGGANVLLPPKFRVLGARFRFRAAETLHPTRAQLGKFGTIDLTTILKPKYPTDEWPALKPVVGQTIEARNAKITFKSLDYSDNTALGIKVSVENLDKGNDAGVGAVPGCIIYDDAGNFAGSNASKELNLIGPGKTVEGKISFQETFTENAAGKSLMICFNNYDFDTGAGTMDMFSLN